MNTEGDESPDLMNKCCFAIKNFDIQLGPLISSQESFEMSHRREGGITYHEETRTKCIAVEEPIEGRVGTILVVRNNNTQKAYQDYGEKAFEYSVNDFLSSRRLGIIIRRLPSLRLLVPIVRCNWVYRDKSISPSTVLSLVML